MVTMVTHSPITSDVDVSHVTPPLIYIQQLPTPINVTRLAHNSETEEGEEKERERTG